MAFWNWSKTAASNATGDATINWAEGQPAPTVNDSGRAMMARLAEYRDDTSGLLVTAGSATAYTLTSNQGLNATPNDGQLIAFSPHTANGTNPTLRVDGGNTYPVQFTPASAIPANSLLQGTPYVVKFSVSQSAWVLCNFFSSPFLVPVGALVPFVSNTVPNANFAFPYGQAISRTTYSVLFGLTGTTYGTGDGSTTFNIPDLRGRAVFGLDNMGGSAANRITVAGGNWDGTAYGGNGGAQNHTLTTAEMPAHNHGITDPGHTHTYNGANSSLNVQIGASGPALITPTSFSTGGSGTGITVNNTGSGNAHTIMPPAMTLPYLLRIL